MQRSKVEIIDYFQEFIFGFVYHDIENCIKAGANYVVALALLSYTEYIGGLISGNLGLRDRGIPTNNFKKALEYFPKDYDDFDSSTKVEYKDDKGKTITETGIYKVFRCGMVHEYFGKGCGIVFNNPGGHAEAHRIGVEVMNVEMLSTGVEEKLPILRTNEYFRDFKSAVEKIYKSLIIDCDHNVLEEFNRSLDRIYSRKILQ